MTPPDVYPFLMGFYRAGLERALELIDRGQDGEAAEVIKADLKYGKWYMKKRGAGGKGGQPADPKRKRWDALTVSNKERVVNREDAHE